MIIKKFKLFESGLNPDIIQDVKDICLEIADLGYKIKYVHESEELVEHYKIIIGEVKDESYDDYYGDYDNDFDYNNDVEDKYSISEDDILINSPVMMDFYKRLYDYLDSNNYYLRIQIDGYNTLVEGDIDEDLINRYKMPLGSDSFDDFQYLEIVFCPKENLRGNVNERLSPSTYYSAGDKLKQKKHHERGDELITHGVKKDKSLIDFAIVAQGVHEVSAKFDHFNFFLINEDVEREFIYWERGELHDNCIRICAEPVFINRSINGLETVKFCPFIITFMIFGEYKRGKDLEDLLKFDIGIIDPIDFSMDKVKENYGFGVITERTSAVRLRNIILNIKNDRNFLDLAEEIISNHSHLGLDVYEKFLSNIDKIRVNNLYIPYDGDWDEFTNNSDITK